MGRILKERDVEAAVKGGSVYAAGGGGWADHGRMLGYAAVSVGKPELVDATELARAVDQARWDARPTLAAHAALSRIASATSPGARVASVQEPAVTRAPLRCVPELVPEAVAKASYYKLDQAAPVAKIDDLANYDAIIVGTGTRFGRMASQMGNFLDQAGGLWMKGALHGKVGGAFTSSATQHGGQETTLFSVITNLLHFGMTIVGLNYGFAGQMKLDEVTGGSPYGATTITGGDGSRQPSENELAGARYQGRAIAETANKLHG